ncbi:hypothetical protein EVAR_42825_1 [Eumeta japonica]|uniref:Uncharacterized protein n=1 Tax=Eumeta variegata TaxID=151549 RepID=A0A4C1WJ39_EUMVA|nr:hypothetical protein EVAR_42825_1 [Eumeta japonica]
MLVQLRALSMQVSHLQENAEQRLPGQLRYHTVRDPEYAWDGSRVSPFLNQKQLCFIRGLRRSTVITYGGFNFSIVSPELHIANPINACLERTENAAAAVVVVRERIEHATTSVDKPLERTKNAAAALSETREQILRSTMSVGELVERIESAAAAISGTKVT